MSTIKELEEYSDVMASIEDNITFKEYLQMVVKKPQLAALAHQRMYETVAAKGRTFDEEGDIYKYNFFDGELFGIDEPLAEVMKYFESAGPGSEMARRILLLYGPPSSGKSQLAILLKRGLEEYSLTDEGATYAIAESPMHENPLLLVPNPIRKKLLDDHGIYIEGELSPYTSHLLRDKYKNDFMKVPVKRIVFSERDRVGITTFLPSDPKAQDISELTGSLNLAKIGEYGVESDPRAFSFDGALNKANRGMVEMIEMLKCEPKFLYVLLTLSQEKNIKVGRFPLIYCDESIIAHTNESEFKNFYENKEMEAFHDRMITIKIPYNLQLDNEIKIYEKLLDKQDLKGIKIAPHTLKVAAMFAIMTRLAESKHQGMTFLKKMQLYNGQDVEGFTTADIKKLREESDREGMEGISPRYIINRLSSCAVESPDIKSITPLAAIRSIKAGLETNAQITPKQKKYYMETLSTVYDEYAGIARREVKKAFFVNFENEIQNLIKNYIDNIKAFLDNSKIVNPVTGDEEAANEQIMRSIEEHIGISENGKIEWRNEICRKMLDAKNKSGVYDYRRHDKLTQALEEQMFDERSDIIRITVSSRNPDKKELKRINEVVAKLVNEFGHTEDSANELLKFVNHIMRKKGK